MLQAVKRRKLWLRKSRSNRKGYKHTTSQKFMEALESKVRMFGITSMLRLAARNWIDAVDGADFAWRFEKTKKFRKVTPVSISFVDGLFEVTDGDEKIAVARKSRLQLQIAEGLVNRRNLLKEEYCIPEGLIRPNDIVIDCGANIGEFSIMCALESAKVFAFEPDKREYLALRRNSEALDITPFNIALWNENGQMEFFDNNDTGDSSLLASKNSGESYAVTTRRLDDIQDLAETSIRLIKLEAEGAEPEILEGMRETLERTEFITVDMGPERGANKVNTLAECTNLLYECGFKMKKFFSKRCTALFGKR